MKSVKFNPLTSLVMAAALAIGLAGCGGSSNEKSAAELEMERLEMAEADCTSAGGRWNDDNTCTSADEREMEAAQMNCEAGGGRYESDGSCTSAADVEEERLDGLEMACEGAGGRWNDDNTCTSAADLALAGLEMVCNDAGGRWESDNTCTSAADLQLERAEMNCTGADGRWNADNTCTSAAELAEMECTDDDGRWNADGTCTSAAELVTERQETCTDAGGRWNADGTCTSAAELVTERQEACTDAGGRWNGDTADDMCSDVTELAGEQRMDINGKIEAAQNAVDAVNDDSSDAMVTAADNAVAAASMAIENAANIDDDEKAAFNSTVGAIRSNLATRKSSRQTAMENDKDMADKAMAATATKLYAGISAQMGAFGTDADGDRTAAYSGTGDANISVTFDPDLTTAGSTNVDQELTEDKDAMVVANYGWEGTRYTASGAGVDGTYEAVVYSNVGAPEEGRRFGSTAAVTASGAYEYQLVDFAGEDGVQLELAAATITGNTSRVAFSDVTRTAGTETFHLPDPNPTQEARIRIPGSFHGVSGHYYCDPATDTAGCTASVAAGGGFLVSSGDTWTFRPGSAETRVSDMADSDYASYGWWIHKSADDMTYTASVFVDEKGTASAAISTLDALNGTAKYTGGAAGKYALSSSTGGTNDAGHFTARAMLEANFTTNDGTDTTTNAIDGTIDMFMGADGQRRPWVVKLNGSPITNAGVIGGATSRTVWTIDGTAADASGQWSGNLRNNGADGVPQVATGTFYSEYEVDGGSTEGRMVGAFGANKCSNSNC